MQTTSNIDAIIEQLKSLSPNGSKQRKAIEDTVNELEVSKRNLYYLKLIHNMRHESDEWDGTSRFHKCRKIAGRALANDEPAFKWSFISSKEYKYFQEVRKVIRPFKQNDIHIIRNGRFLAFDWNHFYENVIVKTSGTISSNDDMYESVDPIIMKVIECKNMGVNRAKKLIAKELNEKFYPNFIGARRIKKE